MQRGLWCVHPCSNWHPVVDAGMTPLAIVEDLRRLEERASGITPCGEPLPLQTLETSSFRSHHETCHPVYGMPGKNHDPSGDKELNARQNIRDERPQVWHPATQ